MAQYYAAQQVGVSDGTTVPAGKADGRLVGAKLSSHMAAKVAAQAWANGDTIVLGTLRAGESLKRVWLTSDTTLGTTTVSIGTAAAPTKYVNAKTMTTVDIPTLLGVRGTAADDGAITADEVIIATLGVGGVAGGIFLAFELEYTAVK